MTVEPFERHNHRPKREVLISDLPISHQEKLKERMFGNGDYISWGYKDKIYTVKVI